MISVLNYLDDLGSLGEVLLAVILLSSVVLEIYHLISPVFQWMYRLDYLCWMKDLVQRARILGSDYTKVIRDFQSGIYYKPFGRKEPLVVRSPAAIQELCEAPQLSQRAVYADIFGFQYTMSHANIDLNPNEQITLRYRLFARAIRVKGLAQIGTLYPYLQARLNQIIGGELEPLVIAEGWSSVHIAPLMRQCATGLLGVYMFGNKLSDETEFSWAMSQYYDDTIACMGALQAVPSFLRRSTYNLITKRGRSLDVLLSRLLKAVAPDQDAWGEDDHLKSITLLHNMAEASEESSYWTPIAVIQALLGIWFAASHQPWINLHFVFLELCGRPEYIELIRSEICAAKDRLDHETICQLPILDSFIKESVRLNPLDKMGIRRKAIQPFVFQSTGQHVPVGQIACVPAWEFMHDETQYPYPETFDGHRFVKGQKSRTSSSSGSAMRGTTFTDASKDFPIWGLGSKVCPGRWHASLVIKLVLVKLIQEYDFRLEDEKKRVKWFWETFQMPYENTRVLMRKRRESGCM